MLQLLGKKIAALLLSPAETELHFKLKKLQLCVSPSCQDFFSAQSGSG